MNKREHPERFYRVIAAAAHLTDTLEGIKSPQLQTSTLKSLGDLQDIFHEAANKTHDPSPSLSPGTPPRVKPTPTPGPNGHKVNDTRDITRNVHNAQNEEIITQEVRVPLHTRRVLPTPIPINKPLRRSQRIADLGILSTASPPTDDTPARNTRSQVQERTITQETILACMTTYNDITSRRLTPSNAARRTFLIEILNAVLHMDTGELLEMRHLLVNPKYKDVWGKSYTTELGRLAQGIPGVSEGTNTIVFITRDEIPMNRLKNVTYGRICANYRPEKADPNRSRLTVGGDRLNVPGDCGTPTVRRWPPSNPCMRGPREHKPQEEWAPRLAPAAAIRQPLGLRGWLVVANLRCEAGDQRRPGGEGCSVRSSRTTTRGRVGEAATI